MVSGNGQILFNSQTSPANPVEEGINEALKELVVEEQKGRQKLDDLVEKSNRVLFKTSAVFPFDFFPNEIIIDENKVSIIQREFFWSSRIHSVIIRDISDVYVDTSILFATLVIIDEGFTDREIRIPYLWKNEALEARRIIQGLVVSLKGANSPMLGGVELTNMSQQDLMVKVKSLGRVQTQIGF